MNAVAGVVDAAAVNVQDFAGETRGVIGAAVVDDDYLGVGPTLAQVVYDRRQGVSQAGRLVISRNNDRERRRHSVSALYHSALGAVVELAPWCGRPEHVRATGPKARTEGSQRKERARRARRPLGSFFPGLRRYFCPRLRRCFCPRHRRCFCPPSALLLPAPSALLLPAPSALLLPAPSALLLPTPSAL